MKAAVFHGPKDLRIERMEIPEVEDNWALVKVRSCGICGSDLHMYKGTSPELQEYSIDLNKGCRGIFGHELAGDIEKVGKSAGELKAGDRVAVCPMWGCGVCDFCKSGCFHLCKQQACLGYTHIGGYAEYLVAPTSVCYKIPPRVSYEEGGTIEQLACGIHACTRGNVSAEDVVVVLGAGAIGLSATAAARALGARHVVTVDMLEHPLEVAKAVGADHVINASKQDTAEEVRKIAGEDGASVIIEAVGGEQKRTLPLAIKLAARRARIVSIGIFSERQEIDIWRMLWKEISLIPSWAFCYVKNQHEYAVAVDLVSSNRVTLEPIVTHRFPLDEITKAFEVAIDKKSNAIKVHTVPA